MKGWRVVLDIGDCIVHNYNAPGRSHEEAYNQVLEATGISEEEILSATVRPLEVRDDAPVRD